jgi:hypothetical protein
MFRRISALSVTAGITILTACLGSNPPTARNSLPAPRDGIQHRGSATIIPGSELRVRGGSLIDALAGRVSNMRVDRRSGARCPIVSMRGFKTIIGDPNPVVYVDGTPMSDTCILTQLRIAEVSRVELYPSGLSHRAGYSSSANGLILVFLTGTGSPD